MGSMLPFILNIAGWMIGKYFTHTEAMKKFVALVSELEFGGLRSVKLRESVRAQIEAHKTELAYGELEITYQTIVDNLAKDGYKMDHKKKKLIKL